MALAAETRWVPKSNGGIDLVASDGTVLLSLTAAGALTFGAGVTTPGLRVQNMTGAQRDALTASAGTIIYNTTTNKLNVRVAAAWEAVTSA